MELNNTELQPDTLGADAELDREAAKANPRQKSMQNLTSVDTKTMVKMQRDSVKSP